MRCGLAWHRLLATVAAALAAAAVLGPPATAQDRTGTTAFSLFDFAPAPRPAALGGAYAAIARDPFALFYNPARLAVAAPAVGLGYESHPADAGLGSLVAGRGLGPGGIAIGVQFLDFGEIDVMEPDPGFAGQRGRRTGERVGGGEVAVSIGYGAEIGGAIQVGAAAKLLRAQVAEAADAGAAVDLGLSTELLDDRLVLAASAQHIGRPLGPARPAPLPMTMRAGAAWRIGGHTGVGGALMLEAVQRDGVIHLASGAELGLERPDGRAVRARIGYDDRLRELDATAPFTVGAGVRSGGITVDYAFRALGPLGAAHQFGISFAAGGG